MFAPLRPVASSLLRQAAKPVLTRVQAPLGQPLRAFSSSRVALEIKTRYTAEHEWVKFDDATNVGVIGITDHAQHSLGEIVFVELPSEGTEVKQGDQIGAVESVKAASDIYSPVSGTVESVNAKLGDQASILNKSPEAEGWLCKIRLTNPAEFETLLTEEAYKAVCEE
ncbi:putative glycine cleavage system H protein, mitochondrial precursor [Violaceomyces palustris]|uniref:Glycine cleavage system H protein, mitochondrial n=1 Tax=Violaceomyces palustris TaxID=1673888 RepID=A0ACD0NWX4_9BASI|nr:putative glycine cleavage system H protein, mitochondrial precursor [Violaceomyces palustris]